jgi:hypothetical protein
VSLVKERSGTSSSSLMMVISWPSSLVVMIFCDFLQIYLYLSGLYTYGG